MLDMALRRGRIGASLMPAIVGCNPWKGPLAAWLEVTGRHQDGGDTERTRLGHKLEGPIAEMVAEKLGVELAHFGSVLHPEHDWLLATPDRAVFGQSAIVECKLVGQRVAHHWGPAPDGVPEYVLVQCLTQLEVTGASVCYVGALIGGTEHRIYIVERDAALQRELVQVASEFMRDHVIPDEPPPYDQQTSAQALATLFAETRGDVVAADADAASAALAYLEARAARDAAEERMERAKADLCARIQDHDGVEGETWRATWKWREETEVKPFTRPRYRHFDLRVKAKRSRSAA